MKADAGGTTTLDIDMKPDYLSLDEVVVTGTSVATSKRQLGNAISTVQVSNYSASVATSIDQLLTGKVAGAQITQNSGNLAGGISVRLRGPSTIVGSSDPLYIIDGVIVNNSSPELIDGLRKRQPLAVLSESEWLLHFIAGEFLERQYFLRLNF